MTNKVWGRKFCATIIAMGLLTIITVLGIWFSSLNVFFPTFCSSLVGILTLYLAGNVTQKVLKKEPENNNVENK